ncbi:MAG TPA: hypothetical protein VGD78_22270 [Chthoniobacterales bacterium]
MPERLPIEDGFTKEEMRLAGMGNFKTYRVCLKGRMGLRFTSENR